MFYDEPGSLLRRAGELLSRTEAPDEAFLAQLRLIGVQLKRLGAMWPDLFSTLDAENRILLAAHADIVACVPQSLAVRIVADDEQPADPVLLNAALLRQLNDMLPVLHEHRHEAWGAAALQRLRRAVADAAGVQGALTDKAWAS